MYAAARITVVASAVLAGVCLNGCVSQHAPTSGPRMTAAPASAPQSQPAPKTEASQVGKVQEPVERLRTTAPPTRSVNASVTAVPALVSRARATPANQKKPQLTDAAIQTLLIRESRARYYGSCACPYNVDRAGRKCGRRSAYSKPGGASPLCYAHDVSAQMIAAYRARQ